MLRDGRRPEAGEDYVVHAGGAHVLVGTLAHDPAHGLDEIRLAAAVRADNAGKARSILNSVESQKLLKPASRSRSNFIGAALSFVEPANHSRGSRLHSDSATPP